MKNYQELKYDVFNKLINLNETFTLSIKMITDFIVKTSSLCDILYFRYFSKNILTKNFQLLKSDVFNKRSSLKHLLPQLQ